MDSYVPYLRYGVEWAQNDVAERETGVVFAWGLTRKAFPH